MGIMENWVQSSIYLATAAGMVLFNAFFVAAEFGLVKVRGSRLEELAKEGKPFASTACWLGARLDTSLSACQLGITIGSLGLGWVGEPAFAGLLKPAFVALGVTSPTALRTSTIVVAFTIITALHLIIGEQAPKIYAIRRPESVAIWCAVPLKVFYVLSYPFLMALTLTTSWVLRLVGIESTSEEDVPHSEAEIRALVRQSHIHGELTRAEHRLIHAIFEFDDMICRRVMVPRRDAVFLDVEQSFIECLEIINRTKHSRYPLCEDSLERVVGIVHVKDLVGVDPNLPVDLRKFARPPHHVPETMPMSQLLRHFQRTHQLMALVVDEYGTIVGVVTLENVMEQIVGSVEDEFDREPPPITAEGEGQFVVLGSAPVETVNEQLGLQLVGEDVDTIAGALVERMGRLLEKGDRIDLEGAQAEVIEVEGARAKQIRIKLQPGSERPKDAEDGRESADWRLEDAADDELPDDEE
ncbi:MAG: HlyC/CorC family transporter [Planctomycetaceae bacterium]|nr:HlyC/CorC family transporter [Planctomycetaceae bacterium]